MPAWQADVLHNPAELAPTHSAMRTERGLKLLRPPAGREVLCARRRIRGVHGETVERKDFLESQARAHKYARTQERAHTQCHTQTAARTHTEHKTPHTVSARTRNTHTQARNAGTYTHTHRRTISWPWRCSWRYRTSTRQPPASPLRTVHAGRLGRPSPSASPAACVSPLTPITATRAPLPAARPSPSPGEGAESKAGVLWGGPLRAP